MYVYSTLNIFQEVGGLGLLHFLPYPFTHTNSYPWILPLHLLTTPLYTLLPFLKS